MTMPLISLPCARAVLFVTLTAASTVAFCQSGSTVSRAEVKAELRQLEAAGYNPAISEDADYPNDIQAAEARVSATAGNHAASRSTPDSTGSSLSTGHAL
ncbi:hypothetical protein P3T18_004362 [Paraburkholderia sp. GAS199]|uniref:DUF4148 domain-containing protein n=1 Tax=Paraburkholderia sp. GAS199 TaxID=3035126 RepID=UPI003D2242B3